MFRFLLFLFLIQFCKTHFSETVIDTSYGPPRPIMTIHAGHISLNDQLLITTYTGTIQPGEPYTLDIYMGNTDHWDYVIERCLYNDRTSFLDNYGCLRRDQYFLQKWETNEYTLPGAMKRTLVHFIAPEPTIQFQCEIKIIECCGCAEESCERQPPLTYFPVYNMPIFCSYPNNPGIIVPPRPPPPAIGYGGYRKGYGFWIGIPWWLWLLLLLLLLILLCLLVCAVFCCLSRRRNSRQETNSRTEQRRRKSVQVHPEPKPQTLAPAPALPPKPLVIDTTVQTSPETKQASQQVDSDLKIDSVKIETGNGNTYQKRNKNDYRSHRRMNSTSSTTANQPGISLIDGPFYSENSGTIHRTIYETDGQFPGYIRESDRRRYDEEYVNLGTDTTSNYQQYNAVPIHRANTRQQQDQFQFEIEERLRREQERHELEERIERHLSEHREQHERQLHEYSPNYETMREETYRTVKHSSVI